MRKYLFLSPVLFSLSTVAFAQFQLGLKFSPSITSDRPILVNDTLEIKNAGSNLKFSMGLIGDLNITETYVFSTGIIYIPKTFGMKIEGENGGTYINPKEEYNVQYLQVPITLKLFTNEIVPDVAIFFQVGFSTDFRINDIAIEEEYTLLKSFKVFDTSVVLGGGIEYRAGINTVLFVDASYQRGLIDIVKSTEPSIGKEFDLRSTVLMIDFGIKF